MKGNFMWKAVGCVLFILQLLPCCQSEDANECMKRQKNLALLDLTEETISKAKKEIPDCESSENGTQSNTTDCKKGKTLAFLDIAANLIADVKGNYSTCSSKKAALPFPKPMDCSEVLKNGQNKSGVYTIWPRSRLTCNQPLEVYCDMDTEGGGWTIIQRRGNFGNQEDFARNWEHYKNGFGNISRDFWIGNDNIYMLSNQGCYEVRFDLEDVLSNTAVAVYSSFWIEDEKMNYTLHISTFTGNAGDAMEYQNNQQFTTLDRPNDRNKNCATAKGGGGWWYNACSEANLNGIYKRGNNTDGVFWRKWTNYESLESTEIKLRRIETTEMTS